MKKVIVIECPGSGKTTFAEKLNQCIGLPLFGHHCAFYGKNIISAR